MLMMDHMRRKWFVKYIRMDVFATVTLLFPIKVPSPEIVV